MFDFPFTEPSVNTSLYCLVCYLIFLRSNYQDGLLEPFTYEISRKKEVMTLFFIGVFTITHCYKGDFFHLMHRVYDYSEIPGAYNFGEEIYHKIAFYVGKNYFLFRTVVWGGAFCLFCLTAKRMNVSVYYAAVLLFFTHPIIFSYARVTAAMAIYFFGLSFLCFPLNKIKISYILGILIICFSLKFHNSAVVMLLMSFMIFLPVRKWSIILVVIAFFLLSDIFQNLLMDIASSEDTDSTIARKIETYSNREIIRGPARFISDSLQYASFYIPFIITTISVFNDRNLDFIPCSIFRLYKVTSGFILVSLLFLFLGSSYITFVYRVLFMSMIPMSIIIVYLFQSGLMRYYCYMWCVIPGILHTVFMYLYTTYLTS